MTLDSIMFDHVRFSPFEVMVICVKANVSIYPHILDDVVRHVVSKGKVFEFILLLQTKNEIMLCDLRQY